MRKLCIAIITVLPFFALSAAKAPLELWELHLTGEGGIQSFERPANRLWLFQQGLVFLSEKRLAIYQVNRTLNPAPLSGRLASGGAGNFVLVARIFDAETGHEIKQLRFVTAAAEFSGILPTHEGKFLLRAGSIVGLFSPDFQLLRSRRLPLQKHAQADYWDVGVTPSGAEVAFVHQERFVDTPVLQGGTPIRNGGSQADVEIADADTLGTTLKLHLPFYLPAWSAHEHFLLTTAPNKPMEDTEFGLMGFNGNWEALRPAWMKNHPCAYKIDLLPRELMAGYGCGLLVVFPESGEKLLNIFVDKGEEFASVAGADHYLAIETAQSPPALYQLYQSVFVEPAHILLYDLSSRKRILAVKLKSSVVKYAVSREGLLAVIDGDVLKVYKPESE